MSTPAIAIKLRILIFMVLGGVEGWDFIAITVSNCHGFGILSVQSGKLFQAWCERSVWMFRCASALARVLGNDLMISA